MNILLVEPYYTGSHAQWANDLAEFSSHKFDLLVMSGHYWKWRMHGGAISLARKFQKMNRSPDLILGSDMLDLPLFQSLAKKELKDVPSILYFHENQITYPWSESDRDVINDRDRHYGFINYASALSADKVVFNSNFHKEKFLKELPKFLKAYPDHNNLDTVEQIADKSVILPVGIRLDKISNQNALRNGPARILWNHRWEYDKNPEDFFKAIFKLSKENLDFELIILGENFSESPEIFNAAKESLGKRVIQFGFEESKDKYYDWLGLADIVPMTSNQEFFGLSLFEAVASNCYPLLPTRLVYPEHISPISHHEHFYADLEELTNKLRWAVNHVTELRKGDYSHFAEKYDWKNIISKYDDLFEKL